MHHLEGNASPAGRLFTAQIFGPLLRVKCHVNMWIVSLCRAKTVVLYIFWGRISPNINTAKPNLVSIRKPFVPFVLTNFVKIRHTTHTYEAKNFAIVHQNFMKKRVLNLSLSPQPTADPVRKLLHLCTTTFLPLYKSIKSWIKILHRIGNIRHTN